MRAAAVAHEEGGVHLIYVPDGRVPLPGLITAETPPGRAEVAR